MLPTPWNQGRDKAQGALQAKKDTGQNPNLIYSTWETVDRPKQVIVSDMTMFHNRYTVFEVTFYFDVFTKEILTYRATQQRGDRMQYIDGLNDVVNLLKGTVEPVVLHTDQGVCTHPWHTMN